MPAVIHMLKGIVTGQVSGFVGKMRRAAIATREMRKAWKTAGTDISRAASRIGIAVAAMGVGVAKTFAEFESTMVRVRGVTGLLGEQGAASFKKLQVAAKEAGATTVFSARQSAEAMEELGLAGFETGEIIAALPGVLQLASAAQIEIAEAAQVAAGTMKAFGKEASDLSNINDVLVKTFTSSAQNIGELGEALKPVGPVAKAMGVSLEDTSAILAKMADAQFRGGQGGTALRNALIRLASPSKTAKRLIKEFGIEAGDTLFEKLRKVSAGLADATTNEERLGAAAELFGVRGGPAMLAVLEAGVDSLEEFSQSLHDAGGLAQELEQAQLKTLSGQFTLITSAVEGLVVAVGENLVGAFKDLIQSMKVFLAGNKKEIIDGMTNAIKRMVEAGSNLLNFLGEAGPALAETASKFWAWVKPVVAYLAESPRLLASLLALKLAMLSGILPALLSVTKAIWATITAIAALKATAITAFFVSMQKAILAVVVQLLVLPTRLMALSSFAGILGGLVLGIGAVVVGFRLWNREIVTGLNATLEKTKQLLNDLTNAQDDMANKAIAKANETNDIHEKSRILQEAILKAQRQQASQATVVLEAEKELVRQKNAGLVQKVGGVVGGIDLVGVAAQDLAQEKIGFTAANKRLLKLKEAHAELEHDLRMDQIRAGEIEGTAAERDVIRDEIIAAQGPATGVPGLPSAESQDSEAVQALKAEASEITRFMSGQQASGFTPNEAVTQSLVDVMAKLEAQIAKEDLATEEGALARAAEIAAAEQEKLATATKDLAEVTQKAADAEKARAKRRDELQGKFSEAERKKLVEDKIIAFQRQQEDKKAQEEANKQLKEMGFEIGETTDKLKDLKDTTKKLNDATKTTTGGARSFGVETAAAFNRLTQFFNSRQGQIASLTNQISLLQQNLRFDLAFRRRRELQTSIDALTDELQNLLRTPESILTPTNNAELFRDPGLETETAGRTVSVVLPNVTRITTAEVGQFVDASQDEMDRRGRSAFSN